MWVISSASFSISSWGPCEVFLPQNEKFYPFAFLRAAFISDLLYAYSLINWPTVSRFGD